MDATAPNPLNAALAPTLASLRSGYRALVLGASGALGQAFVQCFEADARCAGVQALSRHSQPALVLEDESALVACAQHLAASLAASGPVHIVVDATGALTLDGRGPEKSLNELDAHHLTRAMQVNAIGPALLLKHLTPVLATGERVIWAKLSARVGSISDNRKGGWYGYRASKAALNMLLQTAAIELHRRRPLAVVAALQPGTVRSRLSQPFVGDQAMAPLDSAARLLQALDGLPATGRAHFIDHAGQPIDW
jgi:NAD(P)-dependent dehydrogenase (short-subunit alcohol dehydrogenase family)